MAEKKQPKKIAPAGVAKKTVEKTVPAGVAKKTVEKTASLAKVEKQPKKVAAPVAEKAGSSEKKAAKKVAAVETVEVSEKLAAYPVSAVSLHRAVVAEEANRRQGTQSAQTRAEVRGGGRKPYKQKKTGNARQGSIRAPHYAHGGMALAVKPRDYEKSINRKERRAAILSAIATQIQSGNVVVVKSIAFDEAKTKHATELLRATGLDKAARVLVVLTEYDEATYKSFRNLPNVVVRTAPAGKAQAGVKASPFSARDVMVAHKLLIASDAVSRIEEVWSK